MNLNTYIDSLYRQTLDNNRQYCEMLAISYISNLQHFRGDFAPTPQMIEKYLEKRGYIRNVVIGETIYTKGFVCLKIYDDKRGGLKIIKIWVDMPEKQSKPSYIRESFITSLPIFLKYYERLT